MSFICSNCGYITKNKLDFDEHNNDLLNCQTFRENQSTLLTDNNIDEQFITIQHNGEDIVNVSFSIKDQQIYQIDNINLSDNIENVSQNIENVSQNIENVSQNIENVSRNTKKKNIEYVSENNSKSDDLKNIPKDTISISEDSKNIKKENKKKRKKLGYDELINEIGMQINYCSLCGTIIQHHKNIIKHNKTCKKEFISIYNIEKNTLGNSIYGKGGGDIYIIQPIHSKNNIFKIGGTTNINNILNNLRKMNQIEPLLHYYFPCKDIKKAKIKIKQLINTKYKDIYAGSLDTLKHDIISIQQLINQNDLIEFCEPIVNRACKCDCCNKIFVGKKEIFTHINECKNFLNNHIKSEIDELRDQVSDLIEKNSILENSQNVTNIINNTTNNTFNITLNGYKSENLSYINKDILTNFCKLPYSSIKNLLKYIHFNKNHPENMNVKITNRKEPYAKIYNGKQWVCELKKVIIDDMLDKSYTIIDEHYENEGKNRLDKSHQSRYVDYQKKYLEKDKEILGNIRKDTELLMVNNGLDVDNNNNIIK